MLTGIQVLDECGMAEGGALTSDVLGSFDWSIPERPARVGELVGPLLSRWTSERSVLANCNVFMGGSDSLALALATSRSEQNRLLYAGTFFAVLDIIRPVRKWLRRPDSAVPYRWSLSIPIGAFVESLALTTLSSRSVSDLILTGIEEAGKCKDENIKPLLMSFDAWKIGRSGFIPPRVLTSPPLRPGHLEFSSFEHFSSRLRELMRPYEFPALPIAGGFSTSLTVHKLIDYPSALWQLPARLIQQAAPGLTFLRAEDEED